jgi:hypothetical protein
LSYTLRFSLFILFGWQVTVRCEHEKQSREKGTFLSLGGLHESNHLLGYLIVVLVPMECNKDEALRAKALAERKMLEKDFVGARKMINKAQKLSLELDNITQMLTVCEVHCAAGTKVAGEIDWYGVLQVPPFTADATLIKRQYRKLALLLHPDKNRFAGAEAAFKFVGEANTTLADSSKRCVYDMKRKGSVRVDATTAAGSPPAHHQSWRAGPVRPNTGPVHQQHQHQPSTSERSQSQTYWSICFVCGMQCQNFGLYCANCKDKQGVPYGANQQSNGLYNDAGAPQNHRGQQASSYDTFQVKLRIMQLKGFILVLVHRITFQVGVEMLQVVSKRRIVPPHVSRLNLEPERACTTLHISTVPQQPTTQLRGSGWQSGLLSSRVPQLSVTLPRSSSGSLGSRIPCRSSSWQ